MVYFTADQTPIILSTLPLVANKYYHGLKMHPTMGATMAVLIHTLPTKGLISFYPSPLTPKIQNPDFTPGVDNKQLRGLVELGIIRCLHFATSHGWMSTQELSGLLQPPRSSWSAFQLSHYLKSIPDAALYARPLTFFEHLCAEGKHIL